MRSALVVWVTTREQLVTFQHLHSLFSDEVGGLIFLSQHLESVFLSRSLRAALGGLRDLRHTIF